jgi:hypothetical protein
MNVLYIIKRHAFLFLFVCFFPVVYQFRVRQLARHDRIQPVTLVGFLLIWGSFIQWSHQRREVYVGARLSGAWTTADQATLFMYRFCCGRVKHLAS